MQLPASLRPAATFVLSNALLAAPAFAEAGKIFDFNLTLPLMAGQFLVLMVVLDKLVYTPVGKVLDDRDNELRTKLEAVKDNAGDLLKYTVRGRRRCKRATDPPCACACLSTLAVRAHTQLSLPRRTRRTPLSAPRAMTPPLPSPRRRRPLMPSRPRRLLRPRPSSTLS